MGMHTGSKKQPYPQPVSGFGIPEVRELFFCFVLFSFGGNMFSYNKKVATWLVWFCFPFPASVRIKASLGFGSAFKSFGKKKKKKERSFSQKFAVPVL